MRTTASVMVPAKILTAATWSRGVGYVLLVLAACLGNAEAASASGWKTQPLGPAHGSLAGVSCRSRTFCIAVGASLSGTLTERWNGSSWSILPTPNPPG